MLIALARRLRASFSLLEIFWVIRNNNIFKSIWEFLYLGSRGTKVALVFPLGSLKVIEIVHRSRLIIQSIFHLAYWNFIDAPSPCSSRDITSKLAIQVP